VAERGVAQLVVLGAGFDTFAYRNPHGAALACSRSITRRRRHGSSERLAAMDIAPSHWPRFVGVDFERESFAERLLDAGFDPAKRTFVFWLGVSVYLSAAAIDATLAAVAAWPAAARSCSTTPRRRTKACPNAAARPARRSRRSSPRPASR
jgi:methyltransferase (TIGR00027 family)